VNTASTSSTPVARAAENCLVAELMCDLSNVLRERSVVIDEQLSGDVEVLEHGWFGEVEHRRQLDVVAVPPDDPAAVELLARAPAS